MSAGFHLYFKNNCYYFVFISRVHAWELDTGRQEKESVFHGKSSRVEISTISKTCRRAVLFTYDGFHVSRYSFRWIENALLEQDGWEEVLLRIIITCSFITAKYLDDFVTSIFLITFPKTKEHKSCIWQLLTTINWLVWQA